MPDTSIFADFDSFMLCRIIGGFVMGYALLLIIKHKWPEKETFFQTIVSVRRPVQLLLVGVIIFKYGSHAYSL